MTPVHLALLSASLVTVSVRPWGLGLLALLALVPMHLAFFRQTTWYGSAATSYAVAAAMFIVAFEGAAGAIPWTFPALVVTQALPYALVGIVYYATSRKWNHVTAHAVVPLAWITVEWFQSNEWLLGPAANPINSLGYTQYGTPFMHLAATGGTLLITFVLVLVNALLAIAIHQPRRRTLPLFLAIAVMLAGGQSISSRDSSERTEVSRSLNILVVQGNVTQEEYNLAARSSAIRDYLAMRYAKLTSDALIDYPDIDLVIWPEGAVLHEITPDTLAIFQDQIAELMGGTHLIFGAPYRDDGKLHNAAFHWDGITLDPAYMKRRLVPLGEAGYVAGGVTSVRSINGVHIGFLICLDSLFPAYAQNSVTAGAEALVVLANTAFARNTNLRELTRKASAFRAVETSTPVIVAMNPGPSGIASSDGTLLYPDGLTTIRSRSKDMGLTSSIRDRGNGN